MLHEHFTDRVRALKFTNYPVRSASERASGTHVG